jgi:hypothetical protein
MTVMNDVSRRAALAAQFEKQEAQRKAEEKPRPCLKGNPHDLRAQAVARVLTLIQRAALRPSTSERSARHNGAQN